MSDWLLVPLEDEDGCSSCLGCIFVLIVLAALFGGGAAAGVNKVRKRK